jgi:choline-sulfatase
MKNIIVLMTDDHAQWALGAYGNQELHTPNLDHLARTGVQMNNAFTPTPVCSPARACFLTGRLASQHGMHDYLNSGDVVDANNWLEGEVLLPEILSKNGYQTAFSGKWHMSNDDTPNPAFDNWFSISGDYPFSHNDRTRYCDNGVEKFIPGYTTRVITDKALSFLNEREVEKPFFLMVGYTATHSVWEGHPERLVSKYRDSSFEDIPLNESYPFGEQALESITVDRDAQTEALAQYYAAVTHLDEGVGEILDALEGQGLLEDTLIVYTSDHGLNCGHHGIWGKGNGTFPLNMVDESIRVPLLYNFPGILPGGQKRDEFVDHLDLFQTLLDFANVSPPTSTPQPYAGRSIWSSLVEEAPNTNWRDVQFCEYGDVRMVRTSRYKLVLRTNIDVCDLFDLQADPRENINLADNPEHSDLIANLRLQIDTYFQTYEDPIKSGKRVKELPRHNDTEAWR